MSQSWSKCQRHILTFCMAIGALKTHKVTMWCSQQNARTLSLSVLSTESAYSVSIGFRQQKAPTLFLSISVNRTRTRYICRFCFATESAHFVSIGFCQQKAPTLFLTIFGNRKRPFCFLLFLATESTHSVSYCFGQQKAPILFLTAFGNRKRPLCF